MRSGSFNYGARLDRKILHSAMPPIQMGDYCMNRNRVLEPDLDRRTLVSRLDYFSNPPTVGALVHEIHEQPHHEHEQFRQTDQTEHVVPTVAEISVCPVASTSTVGGTSCPAAGASGGTSEICTALQVARPRRILKPRRRPMTFFHDCMFRRSAVDNNSDSGSDQVFLNEDGRHPLLSEDDLWHEGPPSSQEMSRSCNLL